MDPEREEQSRINPTNTQLTYCPVLKEGDQVTIGCRAIHYASSALLPICNANDRVLQIILQMPLNLLGKAIACWSAY
eukprot:3596291-Amphidinium_carterae.1